MVLPVHALGTNYMAMTYQQVDTRQDRRDRRRARRRRGDRHRRHPGPHHRCGSARPARRRWRCRAAGHAGHDGDLYQLLSENDFDDLSGHDHLPTSASRSSRETSPPPTARSSAGINSPDMAMEQMMPVGAWSTSYVAARLPPQTDDLRLDLSAHGRLSCWRIIASDDAQRDLHLGAGHHRGLARRTDGHARASPIRAVGRRARRISSSAPTSPSWSRRGWTASRRCRARSRSTRRMDVQVLRAAAQLRSRAGDRSQERRQRPPAVTLDGNDITAARVRPRGGRRLRGGARPVPPCFGSGRSVRAPSDRRARADPARHGRRRRSYATTFPTWVRCAQRLVRAATESCENGRRA